MMRRMSLCDGYETFISINNTDDDNDGDDDDDGELVSCAWNIYFLLQ